ncbi:MAG TPA: ABC transporter permease [Ktedonobacterales bacterium]|nr:ABC transporter permease [Ktedonobacterales bacterium]
MIVGKTTGARTRSEVPVYDSSAARIPLVAEFGELLHFRFLVWNLIARDLKIRYKRSALGFIWVMLNPLLMMGVQTIVFSQLFRFNVDHFTVYLLGGTLIWNLYAQGSIAAMSSVQGNGAILRKLHVPPSVFVVSAVGSAVVNLIFALAPFLVLTLANGLTPQWSWLFLLVPLLLTTLFTLGIGLIIGALMVFFTDTFEIYQVLVSIYYFLTPIFYPVTILPEPLRTLESFNPMALFLSSFRNAVIAGTLPSLHHVFYAVVAALGTLFIGWLFFTRLEDRFVYYF